MRAAVMNTEAGLFRLLAWLSPGFPVGAYSYSHGLEWAVEEGRVKDADSLAGWVAAAVTQGAGRVDAALFRAAWQAFTDCDEDGLAWAEERAKAQRATNETALESSAQGRAFLDTVLAAGPDVINHNLETVRRLYRTARPAGRYDRALALLARAARTAPAIPTKSGVMVGLGETVDEVREAIADLRRHDCRMLTIGQYLRPSPAHLPLVRYYAPREFADLERYARDLGYLHVESGPLVRSSYHAHEQADAIARGGR